MLTASPQKHILNRTNTPLHLNTPRDSPRPRTSEGHAYKDDRSSADEKSAPPTFEPPTRVDTNDSTVGGDARRDLKKGVKAVSFLSRRMGGKKQREAEDEQVDDEASSSEGRPEGNDAEVFKQSMDNGGIGYNPRHAPPPAYIKVRSKYKKPQDFDRVFLAQELSCGKGPDILARRGSANKLRRKSSATPDGGSTIWAMEFSRDGKYLATAGADMIVRVWQVLSCPEDRQRHERQESSDSESNGMAADSGHLSAPVFQCKPVREYEGHSSTILDLSWSKNNFLLSSSMDKTVRLWHVSRNECLCTFKHNDFVPSISFHPKDDRFFLAGSLDSKLRLWSIPDKSVAIAAQVPDMITAVAFTPDGKYAMAGCLTGLCMFFETEGLKYQTQIHVRSTRGQNAKGSKITGIQAFNAPTGELKILITSNDSRIRLYNFRDKSLELKFKGNENNCSQIRAMLSDDGRYVACGSEDRKAYIWSLHQSPGERRDRTPVEMFEAHNTITTAVCMAPAKTRQHLSRSEDPVYDLCNPPPVTLLSQAEKAESTTSVSRPQSRAGSIQQTPSLYSQPRESPAFMSRASHKEGNIIVTADFAGKIKVFRQDCAWSKRLKDDADRASLFSKRGSKSGRAGSLATKNSIGSLRESRKSTSTMGPSDRILSWRQGIASTPSVNDGPSRSSTKASSRSMSPRNSLEIRGRSNKPGSIRSAHPLAADVMVRSPSPIKKTEENGNGAQDSNTPDSPRSGKKQSEENPLHLEGGRPYLFWDQQVWEDHARRINDIHEAQKLAPQPPKSNDGSISAGDPDHLAVRPPLTQVPTYVSKLSDEFSSEGEHEHFDDAREEKDEDEMKCSNCGGTSFSASRGKGLTRLCCTKCGTSV
ncbi:putative WD repeat-containing protein C3H5.08c [Pseudocercospora fuligena]|uniref:Putative WD repeat-containing protein C3H5.08c n=1 Tax=Pseudocercospora fuligena TaxID=685502 RepID=A0A8H6REM0_9PEZI|nr:putative WD repeat-containing protein C3H5.08c [Pseudocercospora fuligena]